MNLYLHIPSSVDGKEIFTDWFLDDNSGTIGTPLLTEKQLNTINEVCAKIISSTSAMLPALLAKHNVFSAILSRIWIDGGDDSSEQSPTPKVKFIRIFKTEERLAFLCNGLVTLQAFCMAFKERYCAFFEIFGPKGENGKRVMREKRILPLDLKYGVMISLLRKSESAFVTNFFTSEESIKGRDYMRDKSKVKLGYILRSKSTLSYPPDYKDLATACKKAHKEIISFLEETIWNGNYIGELYRGTP